MKIKNIFSYLLCLVIILAITGSVTASSGEIVGLGNNYVGLEGTSALEGNPAMVNPEDEIITMELDGDLFFWNNGIDSNYLNKYLDTDIKNKILSNIGNNGLILNTRGGLDGKIILGPIGLFGGARLSQAGSISQDIVDLVLNGNEIDTPYKLEGTKASMAVYGDAGLNVSTSFKNLATMMGMKNIKLGGSYHYLTGGIFKFVGQGEAQLTMKDNLGASGDGYIDMKYSENARGSAFDIGTSLIISDRFMIGASLMNIGTLVGDDGKHSKLKYVIDESNDEFVTLEEIAEDEPLEKELVYSLPREIKLGTKYKFDENYSIYTDYSYKKYDMGVKEHIFALGTEFGMDFLPLRIGVNYSSLQKSYVLSGGLGLYLGPFQIDAGFSDLSLLYNNAKSAELGVDARICF